MTPPVEPEKPGWFSTGCGRGIDWFDHVMRAQERYQDSKGDFYAAGITYFTIFALFPLLMVGFAIGGFVLASHPELLAEIQEQIKSTVSGDIGAAAGRPDGLGDRVAHLGRDHRPRHRRVGGAGLDGEPARGAESDVGTWRARMPPGFVRTKLSDLTAMVGLFLATGRHHRAHRAGQFGR